MSDIRDILDGANTPSNNGINPSVLVQLVAIGVLVFFIFFRDGVAPEPGPGPGPDPGPQPTELEMAVSRGVRDFVVEYNEKLAIAADLLADRVAAQEFETTDDFRKYARAYTEEARIESTKNIDRVMAEYVPSGKISGTTSAVNLEQILRQQVKTHREIAGEIR